MVAGGVSRAGKEKCPEEREGILEVSGKGILQATVPSCSLLF